MDGKRLEENTRLREALEEITTLMKAADCRKLAAAALAAEGEK